MAHYIVSASLSGTSARYHYDDAKKALRKARTLQGRGVSFVITDGNDAPVSIEELSTASGPD